MSWVSMQLYSTQARTAFGDTGGGAEAMSNHKVKPETAALIFYLLQHALSVIRQDYGLDTPLPQEKLSLVEVYHREATSLSVRMLYYMMAICTREIRHKNWNTARRATFKAKFGDTLAKYYDGIPGSETAAAMHILHTPPPCTVGKYVDSMVHCFGTGGWGSAFGGKKWKDIAICLRRFVKGETSAEMLLDTAFTLCHNTAPIFNKGMLFTSQNASSIFYILDTQASGQIPQLIDSPMVASDAIDSKVHTLHSQCVNALGDVMQGYVDWHKVQAVACGKVHYGNLIKKQANLGQSSTFAKEAAEAAMKKQEELNKNYFYLTDKVKLPKVKVR
jgi:hypothetical protein